MGLFDGLSFQGDNGIQGLLSRLMPALQQQYAPGAGFPQPITDSNGPSPFDNAQWPQGPMGAPQAQSAGPQPHMVVGSLGSNIPVPTFGGPDPAQIPQNAQPAQYQQPQQQAQQPQMSPVSGLGDHLSAGASNFMNGGLIGGIIPALAGLATGQRTQSPIQRQQAALNQTVEALKAKGVDPQIAEAAKGNPELMKALITQAFPAKQPVQSIGNGYIIQDGKVVKTYDSEDKTPQSVLEYNYYKDHLPPGSEPMDYATFSTAKARASATNINNNVDMNSGQTYDKQLAEGLGKAHAGLANGVEDAQSRARDISAMQGAIDAIQKNGGTTGGLAPAQRLELQKSINAGAAALGIDKPFDESDLSDKEFLTKFNRTMAGAQAKNAVGSRVTNFEMSNFLKANPGLDMTITGNQRLLGIQAQIEQRNIAVGNAIRDATAQAISRGEKINPVTVQKIITDYDEQHHIKDPITAQDLTQSYTLPEFQTGGSNAAQAARHEQNTAPIRRWNPATGELH